MVEVVAALIWQGDRFMICQRPAHKARGLLWEFVGGKVEPGETKEEALIRECREELAVTLSVGDVFMDVIHEYPDLTVHLTLFNATIAAGIPQKLEHNDIKWITPAEISNFDFCPADEEILKKICNQAKAESSIGNVKFFSEKAIEALNGFYVYALIDPRTDEVFYIGKGIGNRVFSHEIESGKSRNSEKKKLQRIRQIEDSCFSVKRLIVNWGLSESEAFAAEATLINLLKRIPQFQLTNEVSGHHVHESLTTEEFELLYGAIPLEKAEIKHSILVIKINKLYHRGMSEAEIYDSVRGFWNASLRSIEARKVKYVFGVYNGLIVGVYKPDEWHYLHEKVDPPQRGVLTPEDYERRKNRIYFICKDYRNLDDEGKFYLHKSIVNLKVNQSSQNPISYLAPEE